MERIYKVKQELLEKMLSGKPELEAILKEELKAPDTMQNYACRVALRYGDLSHDRILKKIEEMKPDYVLNYCEDCDSPANYFSHSADHTMQRNEYYSKSSFKKALQEQGTL